MLIWLGRFDSLMQYVLGSRYLGDHGGAGTVSIQRLGARSIPPVEAMAECLFPFRPVLTCWQAASAARAKVCSTWSGSRPGPISKKQLQGRVRFSDMLRSSHIIPLCGSGLATKKKLMTTLPRCEQFGSGFASSGNDRLVSCERVSRLSDLESAVQAENQSKRIRPRTKTAHDFANIRIRIPRTPVFL